MTTPTIAANAYTAMQRLTSPGKLTGADAGDKLARPDFGSMVENAAQDLVEKGRAAESKQMDLLQNKADVVDVVTAVAETELAMETVVSVRDKVIAAYQQIMQMPI